MAIHGYYSHNSDPPGPYVEAEVHLQEYDIAPTQVEFLVDTGADSTTLLPSDWNRMGIPALDAVGGDYREDATGIGGGARYKTVRAIVRLRDEDAPGGAWDMHVYADLIDESGDEDHDQLPSLLGRDILNKCRCVFDGVERTVTLERLTP